ncbi:MAG: nuclear transport factor 2 family protein [Rhodospirillaceae bacterium]
MSDAVETVKTFLEALGRRDMDAVNTLLGPGFRMTVSGGHVFTTPADFAAFSKGRHKSARKTTDTYEAMPGDDCTVVYAIGSMAGTWNDDTTYEGVRYIDRFEIAHDKIVDMRVWSDMAEFRPVED